MKATVMNPLKAIALFALSLAIAAMGIYVADADDAPGAAVIGMLLMVVGVVLGVRAARNRLPMWAARTALAVGVGVAAFAAFLTHGVVGTAPLFGQSREVPSVVAPAPSPQYAAAVERARELVRAAVLEQNLPGVSVAVGAGGTIVVAEGFGWRDVGTRTPVTPATRFNIGTAASVVIPTVAPLGLTNTGTDAAKEWSPEAIGEEGEDFPPLTLLRPSFGSRSVSCPRSTRSWRSRNVLRPEIRGQQSRPWTTIDVHARPGLLREREGVLFHAVGSRALRAGEEPRQRQR